MQSVSAVELRNVTKTFDSVVANNNVSLSLSLIHISEPTRPY